MTTIAVAANYVNREQNHFILFHSIYSFILIYQLIGIDFSQVSPISYFFCFLAKYIDTLIKFSFIHSFIHSFILSFISRRSVSWGASRKDGGAKREARGLVRGARSQSQKSQKFSIARYGRFQSYPARNALQEFIIFAPFRLEVYSIIVLYVTSPFSKI